MHIIISKIRLSLCYALSMSKAVEPQHIPHKDKDIAYHMEWAFRKEFARWLGERPIGPNFYPAGTDLRNWLLQKGNLRVFSAEDKLLAHSYTNPYTYDASVLAVTFSAIINDGAAFTESSEQMNPLDAEIKRTRLYGELVLYTARLCEVLIKQLLFCTTFPRKYYKRAALGALSIMECNGCRNSEDKRHKISLLGSLAHRYRLCHKYEHCLNQHLTIANRRRNLEAAHSGVAEFVTRSVSAVREQVGKDLTEIGDDFIHMLEHISEIESKMLEEMNLIIAEETQRICPVIKLSKTASSK
jgi:hypothetical protein